MRIRAGVVLVEDGHVVLIERRRAGLHYFVFPGGGVDEGESPEQAAVREMEEETGLRVAVCRKLAVVNFGQVSRQHYFLASRIGGQFGQGSGEEMSNRRPDDHNAGLYYPIQMKIEALSRHDNVFPAAVADLVARSVLYGWPAQTREFFEAATSVWPPANR
jgi:8-oxo-dGTP diphosphatase